ncbi:hypothetical protein LVD15_00275 [Fulvivirga maritima]|uniref:hypothetical protein n=1 Tax=Fulvivirga maritima TaxID=2904247 RepID=UPI001F47E4D9|nr:hypothetical protein [Fulvivirga maritima]UII26907.1 hypothetical protein LVD15_00275 [Fulvivirga maritima]
MKSRFILVNYLFALLSGKDADTQFLNSLNQLTASTSIGENTCGGGGSLMGWGWCENKEGKYLPCRHAWHGGMITTALLYSMSRLLASNYKSFVE